MKSNRAKIWKYIFWFATLVYTGLCFYLYYRQAQQPLDYNNRYFMSDLPYHISMVVEDGWYYSFTAYVYVLLWKLTGGTGLIALFLALVSGATVPVTEYALRILADPKRGREKIYESNLYTYSGAFILNFVMPFYLPMAGAYRYVSYQSGTVWHNSTYQCMKLVALTAVLLFLKFQDSYGQDFSRKTWGIFALVLVLCTGIKPSFLTVFAPVFALFLLYDLCVGRTSFLRAVWAGSSVLPACLVVLWQNAVLFGADTGNGFVISPWETFSLHADKPKLAVLCSLAFPLVVFVAYLACKVYAVTGAFSSVKAYAATEGYTTAMDSFGHGRKWSAIFRGERLYIFSWAMTVVGFLEALLLIETGTRSRDGNFLWGYGFALFWIYVISLQKWKRIGSLAALTKKLWIRIVYLCCALVLVYQVYCGLYFFQRLLAGETYFMMR